MSSVYAIDSQPGEERAEEIASAGVCRAFDLAGVEIAEWQLAVLPRGQLLGAYAALDLASRVRSWDSTELVTGLVLELAGVTSSRR